MTLDCASLACDAAERPSQGFTLIELLAVITIVAILMALAVPSFRAITNSNRIASEVNGLLGDMQFARAEAIKEGQTVTVCTSADGATCAASANWQIGWLVFSDTNASATVGAGEPILRYQKPFPAGDTFVASNAVSAVTFNREGFAIGLPNTVTVTLHDSTNNAKWTRCLAITIVGMMTSQTAGVGACI